MRIFVHGWTGHGNLGDEAFKPALQKVLGPQAELTFGDRIPSDINSYDALCIGGGSFLDAPLNTSVRLEEITIPFGFVGVGIHAIHPRTLAWLDRAAIVVSRNSCTLDNVLVGPDLLYARSESLFPAPEHLDVEDRPRLLVLPNGFYRPMEFSADRTFNFAVFEQKMRNVLGQYVQQDWNVSVQPMMATPGPIRVIHDDRIASCRLMTLGVEVGTEALSEAQLCAEIERADLVISSRFHGCLLAALAGVPFVGTGSHDKMSSYFSDRGWQNYVPLEFFDQNSFDRALAAVPTLDQMQQDREQGRKWWEDSSVTIRAAFGL